MVLLAAAALVVPRREPAAQERSGRRARPVVPIEIAVRVEVAAGAATRAPVPMALRHVPVEAGLACEARSVEAAGDSRRRRGGDLVAGLVRDGHEYVSLSGNRDGSCDGSAIGRSGL